VARSWSVGFVDPPLLAVPQPALPDDGFRADA
jgi:hypothetical protein